MRGKSSANIRICFNWEEYRLLLDTVGLAVSFQYPSASCDTTKAIDRKDFVALI